MSTVGLSLGFLLLIVKREDKNWEVEMWIDKKGKWEVDK
jgi:hypothetical protein